MAGLSLQRSTGKGTGKATRLVGWGKVFYEQNQTQPNQPVSTGTKSTVSQITCLSVCCVKNERHSWYKIKHMVRFTSRKVYSVCEAAVVTTDLARKNIPRRDFHLFPTVHACQSTPRTPRAYQTHHETNTAMVKGRMLIKQKQRNTQNSRIVLQTMPSMSH